MGQAAGALPMKGRALKRGRALAIVAVLVAVVTLGVWLVIFRDSTRDSDVSHQREIFAHFTAYPGASKISEEVYEIRAEGRAAHYGVTTVYRLPAEAKTNAVLAFYRDQIPQGWSEASDETCAASLAGLSPPPTPPNGKADASPTLPPSTLMNRRSRLTIFASTTGARVNGRLDGLTVELSGESATKSLTLDVVHFACGSDTSDSAADRFDNS